MTITILIDSLNILGSFLLSIEAIKLENFSLLRKKFIPKMSQTINPRINWVDGDLSKKDKKSNRNFTLIFVCLLLISGSLFLYLLASKFEMVSGWFSAFQSILLRCSIFLIAAFFIGAILWTILIYLLKIIEKLLFTIEANTSTGIIGIIGFAVIVFSYVVKWSTESSG